jgi:hypothetical protein
VGQYKVLQDIEAEDKLLGPLSLRQFIYAAMVIIMGFVAFKLAQVTWFLGIPFLPPMLFFGLLAAPIGQNQSSEVWLLAKLRYFLFPRRRIWDPDGLQELVHITVPKKVDEHLSNGFSQEEVSSRLKALASTLDTRGWAIKNVSTDSYQRLASIAPATSDRLVAVDTMPMDVPSIDIPTTDVLDTTANPVAQKMNTMLEQSEQAHRQELLQKVRTIANHENAIETAASIKPKVATIVAPQPVAPVSQPLEPQPILNNSGEPIHAAPVVIQNTITQPPQTPAEKPQASMTTPAKTDKLESVQNKSSSMNISHNADDAAPDEVVISLH